MSNEIEKLDQPALACICGVVQFYLLKVGNLECCGCRMVHKDKSWSIKDEPDPMPRIEIVHELNERHWMPSGMKKMKKPTFKEWMNESSRFMCDAYVLCTDGSEQYIKDCYFDYGIQGNEMVTKKSWMIGEYFFVKSVISLSNFRKAD